MVTTIVIAMCLCVVEFLVIVIASPMAKPDLLLNFLPEDIGKKAQGHVEPPKYKQIIAHVLLVVLGVAFLGAMVFLGLDGLKNGYGFWQLYGRFMVVSYTMKVFDILVQDQWLVISTDFFKKIFPETSECEGWKNRKFNNKNQIKRLLAFPFVCLVIAGIFWMISGSCGGMGISL